LERSDFNAAYVVGHNLAGTGSAFGFNRLTELGRKMELASKAENAADVRALTTEITAYLNTVELIYE
jgi:histidine phosphotransfer protein HptB